MFTNVYASRDKHKINYFNFNIEHINIPIKNDTLQLPPKLLRIFNTQSRMNLNLLMQNQHFVWSVTIWLCTGLLITTNSAPFTKRVVALARQPDRDFRAQRQWVWNFQSRSLVYICPAISIVVWPRWDSPNEARSNVAV